MASGRLLMSLGAVAILLTVGWAPAEAVTLQAGTIEWRISGGYMHTSASQDAMVRDSDGARHPGTVKLEVTTLSFTAGVGRCVTDNLELLGSLSVLTTSSKLNSDDYYQRSTSSRVGIYGLSAHLVYNLASESRFVPYFSGGVGVQGYSGNDDDYGGRTSLVAPIVEAGMRVIYFSAVSLNAALVYSHTLNDHGLKDMSSNDFGLQIGLSILDFPDE